MQAASSALSTCVFAAALTLLAPHTAGAQPRSANVGSPAPPAISKLGVELPEEAVQDLVVMTDASRLSLTNATSTYLLSFESFPSTVATVWEALEPALRQLRIPPQQAKQMAVPVSIDGAHGYHLTLSTQQQGTKFHYRVYSVAKGSNVYLMTASARDIDVGGLADLCGRTIEKAKLEAARTALSAESCTSYDCFRIGTSLLRVGDAPTSAQGLLALERACDAPIVMACHVAAEIVYQGHPHIPRDRQRAAKLYEKACGLRDASGCHSLGVLYAHGDLGPKDDARAAALYEQACLLDARRGCGDAGPRYTQGWGVKRDVKRGVELLMRGCAEGSDAYVLTAELTLYGFAKLMS